METDFLLVGAGFAGLETAMQLRRKAKAASITLLTKEPRLVYKPWLVYPTLLAAISDVAHPDWRASAVGVYRLWRDSGYALGAGLSGGLADLFGVSWAIGVIADVTILSGIVAQGVM